MQAQKPPTDTRMSLPNDRPKFPEAARLRPLSHRLIPGGAHTYAKGDDQYPEDAPSFFVRGEGCRVWDCDGNSFIEYGAGLRTITLGHAYAPVVEAAARQMRLGANFVRPGRIELEIAERFLKFIGQPDAMVKFAKNGSDCTTAAIKLARAYTGRDMIAICGDQPFFSVDDWFIGATPMFGGIPQATRDLTVKFRFNDLASIEALFDAHPNRISCLILEAATAEEPRDGFLAGAKALCRKHGAVFIVDETITGYRVRKNSAQILYGVTGDLSVWGKGMANGFALAALAGDREIMSLGGLDHDRERVFLLSTTHGAESHALAAGIAVIDAYEALDPAESMHARGEALKAGVNALAARHGVAHAFEVTGPGGNLLFLTRDATGERSQAYRTLFMQEMIARGVIGPSFVNHYAHDEAAIEETIAAADGALAVYARAIEAGTTDGFLEGRPVKPVWRTFNNR
jgi:glutamate-1-semialdehyde 2,1-aminomutase